MLRLFLASLVLAVLPASSGLAGQFGGFRTQVEPLRSAQSSLKETGIRLADLGTRVDV